MNVPRTQVRYFLCRYLSSPRAICWNMKKSSYRCCEIMKSFLFTRCLATLLEMSPITMFAYVGTRVKRHSMGGEILIRGQLFRFEPRILNQLPDAVRKTLRKRDKKCVKRVLKPINLPVASKRRRLRHRYFRSIACEKKKKKYDFSNVNSRFLSWIGKLAPTKANRGQES